MGGTVRALPVATERGGKKKKKSRSLICSRREKISISLGHEILLEQVPAFRALHKGEIASDVMFRPRTGRLTEFIFFYDPSG